MASIIIPADQRGTVGGCVASALGQTFADFEALFVEDGTPEEPTALIGAVRSEARMRALFRRHGGVSVARDAGLEAARGDLAGFLDVDALYHPRLLVSALAGTRGRSLGGRRGGGLCALRLREGDAFRRRRQFASRGGRV